jgi:hypothetical protein
MQILVSFFVLLMVGCSSIELGGSGSQTTLAAPSCLDGCPPFCAGAELNFTKYDALEETLRIWCSFQDPIDFPSCEAFVLGNWCPTATACEHILCGDELDTHQACAKATADTGGVSQACLDFYSAL